jgi:hypothetical protein
LRIDLPFHLRRSPPRARSGDGFFSIDPVHTRAVIRQSVEDVAALVAWTRAAVTPTVRVLGTSLGGLISLLTVALVSKVWHATLPPAITGQDRSGGLIRAASGCVCRSGRAQGNQRTAWTTVYAARRRIRSFRNVHSQNV